MSLQPTWDSEQRKETATPVTAHVLGQTHTDHCTHSLCVCVCVSMSVLKLSEGTEHSKTVSINRSAYLFPEKTD